MVQLGRTRLPAGSGESGGAACDETGGARPSFPHPRLPQLGTSHRLGESSLCDGGHPSPASRFQFVPRRTRLPYLSSPHCQRLRHSHRPESSRQTRTHLLGGSCAESCGYASYCGASICTCARFYCGSRGVHVSSSWFLTHSSRKTLPIADKRFDSASVFTRKYPPAASRYTSGTSVA